MLTELFLAGRYLRPKRNAVSLITLLGVIGVMLGVAVLVVVLAVMTGFTDLMKEKLVETQAHFQVRRTFGAINDPGHVIRQIEAAGGKAAAGVQSPVMVQHGRRLDMQLLMLGVDPEALSSQFDFEKNLKAGTLSLGKDELIISSNMAARWNVKVGDKVILHSPQRLTSMVDIRQDGSIGVKQEGDTYLPTEFTVAGIYSMGKYDFDRMVLFVGLDDAAELIDLPWGMATSVYGWGPDPFDQAALVGSVRDRLPGYQVNTWEEENQQLLGVLAVEKRMMYLLLGIITLVAVFSITNTLITSVYQKTHEIGLLKALGASDGAVTMIFVLQGLLIGVIGSVCGVAFGVLIVALRNPIMHGVSRLTGQELFPKELYFFNELPAHIVVSDVIIIMIPAILLCTLGALLPALRAAFLDPAKALRYE